MACCTMQEDAAGLPRGDTEDTEVYRKREPDSESVMEFPEPEKETLSCYTGTSCDDTNIDIVTVQPLPMLVTIGWVVSRVWFPLMSVCRGKTEAECEVVDVGCGSRHTVCLTRSQQLWSFGWNKYGQLGVGDTKSRDSVARMTVPSRARQREIAMLRCGDWGTAIITK